MSKSRGTCDLCGQTVYPQNDAAYISAARYGIDLMNSSRHFLPVEGCSGSPLKAQYLEGQPKDPLGCGYDPRQKKLWRDAVKKIKDDVSTGKISLKKS